jgi:hypothetical protein
MEKIIILSGCEGPDEELVAYLGALFPGCSIEILQKDAATLGPAQGPLVEISENKISESRISETKYH